MIQTKSSTVQKLTPRILDQADLVSRTPHHRQQKAEFDAITHQWAGNVRDLINAMQQANLPWSHRVQQLMDAAESGEGLESQVGLGGGGGGAGAIVTERQRGALVRMRNEVDCKASLICTISFPPL